MTFRLHRQRGASTDPVLQPAESGRGAVRIAPREGAPPERRARATQRPFQPLPLAGLALTVVGLVVVLGYGAAAGKRTPVLIAARMLPAGTLLTASDLRSSRIAADDAVLAALVPLGEQASVLGRRLESPLGAGEPLARAQLAALALSPAAFTLTLPFEHALGGQLQPGDRVAVLATFTDASGASTTRTLARELLVLSVGQLPRLGDPSLTTIPVTVALPRPTLAGRLALANSVAKIDLLRESPTERPVAIPAASTPGQGA